MNKWQLKKLQNILNIKEVYNIKATVFDYLRIISIADKKYEKRAKNILFFPIYFTNYDVEDGWVIKKIDLREKIKDIAINNPNYTFVIEENMKSELINLDNVSFIVVDDILKSIDKLFDYQKEVIKNAKVVAVTGSVGKTTTAGLITNVLKSKYKVLRIYSKRITPLILKAFILNLADKNTDFIVLEMSIYYKDHVKILANLLHPHTAVLLNIYTSHLHKDGMETKYDLAYYKSFIFNNAKIGYYNNEDNDLNYVIKNNNLYLNNKLIGEVNGLKLHQLDLNNIKINGYNFVINNKKITPYILSRLSMIQYLVAYKIGIEFKIDKENIIKSLNNYTPVENRINKFKILNKPIIFDGDITNADRMKQLSNHFYDKAYLIIRNFGSAENIVDLKDFKNIFDKFKKVFLFNDIKYLNDLKKYQNTVIVKNHNFIKQLDGMIIYHYSGYFRCFKKFKYHNLIKINEENYKIIEG